MILHLSLMIPPILLQTQIVEEKWLFLVLEN